jgi:uncharacterized protein
VSDRPKPGAVEERTAPDLVTAEDRKIRGRVPYGAESRDMGGWREVIEPGALNATRFDDLVVTVDHAGVPLGRYPTTLELEDRTDGLHWSVSPPESRADVREAIERGDLRAGSWRMVVAPGGDRWDGNVRRIQRIAELRDVSIVTAPAYPAAAVEFRSHNPAQGQEQAMSDTAQPAVEPDTTATVKERTAPPASGGLNVEDRVAVTAERPRGLAEEFRAAGFPGEVAVVPFERFEDRAITWTGSVDNINTVNRQAGALGADQRYVWPAMPRVSVDGSATSVTVFTQTARSLATAANVVRAVDAVTAKPETGSTLTVNVVALKQVATIQTNVPNIYLEQAAFNTAIETDLRLAINDGLDKLVLDSTAASGFQAPGTDPLLVSIRKAMTTIMAAGYSPDTLLLTPANAEALDVLVSGVSGATNDYVFGPGNFATQIFGLNKRVSKTVAAPVVVDSTAFGRLYTSPVSLARFEADAGTTNRSNVRMELNAVFGVERQNAAIRIAAA